MIKLFILKVKGQVQIGRRYLQFILLYNINHYEKDKYSIRKMGRGYKQMQMKKLKWPIKI